MILAVDNGMATCGWAVVRPGNGEILDLGVVLTETNDAVDEWTDRMRRMSIQTGVLADVAERWNCTTFAGEQVSLGGPPKARIRMASSLCLSWGSLVMLATVRRGELYEIPPKQWQHAVQPGVDSIDYNALFDEMVAHLSKRPLVYAKLMAIRGGDRNHAIDGGCIGQFISLFPKQATRIIKRKEAA